MRHTIIASLAAIALMSMNQIVPAFGTQLLLSPSIEDKLNAEARVLYQDAALFYDRANEDAAVEQLAKVAAAQPTLPELQFTVAKRAISLAQTYYSARSWEEGAASLIPAPQEAIAYSSPPWRTSEPFLIIAEEALGRLSKIEELSEEEKRNLSKQSARLEQVRSGLADRDAKRIKTGQNLVAEISALRFDTSAKIFKPEDTTPIFTRAGKLTKPATAKEAADKAAAEKAADGKFDPFALLPGEVVQAFMPAPPAITAGGGPGGGSLGGGRDPFLEEGNPQPADPGLGGQLGGGK